jgi:hypothetical protein
MRLWSLHPSLLDRAGLIALWREGLLAQKVLRGLTVGYRFHPQLDRFRLCKNPVCAVGSYLYAVYEESRARGYSFDGSKILSTRRHPKIAVTKGQIDYELLHLKKKLRQRAPHLLARIESTKPKLHSLFRLVPGEIEPWEVLDRSPTDTRLRPGSSPVRADYRRTPIAGKPYNESDGLG